MLELGGEGVELLVQPGEQAALAIDPGSVNDWASRPLFDVTMALAKYVSSITGCVSRYYFPVSPSQVASATTSTMSLSRCKATDVSARGSNGFLFQSTHT